MEFNQLKQQVIDLNRSINELELHKLNKEQKGELEKLLVEPIESYSVHSDINISSLINSNKLYQQELNSILDTIINYASHDFSNEFENNEFETLYVLTMAIQMLGEELKVSNMKVLHTEELFQTIFNNSPLSIVKMDENLKVLDINNSFCNFIGASKSELLGSNLSEFTHPEDLKKDKQNLLKLISGEIQNFTRVKKYISKSGEMLWGQVSACVVVNDKGAFQYLIGMIKDVTKEHRVNQEVKESEKTLKEAQRIGNLGHWQLDLIKNKLLWSDQQFIIWGIDKEQMDASYEGFLNSIHPEDRDKVTEAYESSLVNKTPYSIVHRLLMDDGEIKYVREVCETKYNDEGVAILSIGTTQDITKEIVQENRIQKSLEEKEILLKEIHHRVKNNLQIISGLLEMQSYRTKHNTVKKELGETKARIRSIALIHEQLYKSNDFNSVDLKEYVDQLLIEIASIYSLQGKLISVKNNISGINININKAIPIGLILNELITNATKHAFIKPNNENLITIIASESNGSLYLNITDNGIGFKNPFNNDHITTMGLKMIKALVGQLAAEYKVVSNSSGTKFNIDIPL